jgi:hypothetical protein
VRNPNRFLRDPQRANVIPSQRLLNCAFSVDRQVTSPAPELMPEAIGRLSKSERATFIGFVVDDETSAPLADVVIASDNSAIVRTNSRGFFNLRVAPKIVTDSTAGRSLAAIRFTLPGYLQEVRSEVEVITGVVPIYNVRLKAQSCRLQQW